MQNELSHLDISEFTSFDPCSPRAEAGVDLQLGSRYRLLLENLLAVRVSGVCGSFVLEESPLEQRECLNLCKIFSKSRMLIILDVKGKPWRVEGRESISAQLHELEFRGHKRMRSAHQLPSSHCEQSSKVVPNGSTTYRSASNSLLTRTVDRTPKTFALQGDPSRPPQHPSSKRSTDIVFPAGRDVT
ncbi:hypothetical protein AVEN_183650-1 [Araneus ventricosus]|uniref:Uncharacterized protein n=1 Tax=Araneus ventricosus TaxID=182803 RepID=A0A4Y2I1B7_ARAVE|nr:hypothetical protein AVEN_183650-1 [Araneus ventricosus]